MSIITSTSRITHKMEAKKLQRRTRFVYLLFLIVNINIFYSCFPFHCAQAAESHFEKELPAAAQVDPHDIWNYENQEAWSHAYPSCASSRQSPINIDTSRVKLNRNYKLSFVNYEQDITFRLKNTHHTVNFDPMQLSEFPALETSWLPGAQYELHDIHFHWGARASGCGSEHKVDNQSIPSEVHFVHFLKGLTKDEALARQDSIVVIGVFIDESTSFKNDPNYNAQFDQAISYFASVSGDTQSEFYDLPLKFNPFEFLPANKERFYSYNGSLTTPACSEVVSWVVMDEHVSVSGATLDILRNMKTAIPNEPEHDIGPNFREPQQLNGREIIATFVPPPHSVMSAFRFPIASVRALFQGIRGMRIKEVNPLRMDADVDPSMAIVVKANNMNEDNLLRQHDHDDDKAELVDLDNIVTYGS